MYIPVKLRSMKLCKLSYKSFVNILECNEYHNMAIVALITRYDQIMDYYNHSLS